MCTGPRLMAEQEGYSRMLLTAPSQAPSPCPKPGFLSKEFHGADEYFLKRFRKVQVLQHNTSVGILGTHFQHLQSLITCLPSTAVLEPCAGCKWQFRNQSSIKFSCCGTSAFTARFGQRRANVCKLQSTPEFQSALSSGELGQSEL